MTMIFQKQKRRRMSFEKEEAGFTLVEMIVAVGLFLIVVTISGSAILTVIDTNRKASQSQVIMDNLSMVLEDMTRTIRTAEVYDCGNASGGSVSPTNCPTAGSDAISLDSARQGIVTYERDGSTIKKTWHSPLTGRQYNELPMTTDNMTIHDLDFNVVGDSPNPADPPQPYVILHIRGEIRDGSDTTDIDLQTVVTRR